MAEEITKEQTQQPSAPLSRAGLDEALANMASNPTYQLDYVFYLYMIGQCSIRLERMKAAAAVSFDIDHFNLHINPELFDKFSLVERMAVLKHEMLHILNGHLGRLEDRHFKSWNYATDCAINQLIVQDHLPQGCILPANFPSKKKVTQGLSSEQYYELIDKDQLPPDEPQDGEGQSGKGQGGGNGQGGGHEKWAESQGDPELQKDITKNMIEKAINQTQKSRGNLPSNLNNWLDMFSRKAELSWKKVLRGIVGNKKVNRRKTIMRRDRRNPNFEWIKGNTKDRMFDLLLVSDVSGSVSDQALLALWGEVRHICDITKTPVNLIQVDTHPSRSMKLEKKTKIIPRKACGGTYLSPALDQAKKEGLKFNAVVVTTDGYLDNSDVRAFEDLGIPVIWLIEAEGAIMDQMSYGRMRAFKLKSNSNE